jgi:hypothetical protein
MLVDRGFASAIRLPWQDRHAKVSGGALASDCSTPLQPAGQFRLDRSGVEVGQVVGGSWRPIPDRRALPRPFFLGIPYTRLTAPATGPP